MIKHFCDVCEKQIIGESFLVKFQSLVEQLKADSYFKNIPHYEICHDCYWAIQGFMKSRKPDKQDLCDRCGERPRVRKHYDLCCECIVPFNKECDGQ